MEFCYGLRRGRIKSIGGVETVGVELLGGVKAEVVQEFVISLAVGKLWHRGRPFTRDRQIWNFTGHKANASFPSNHAMNSAAVAFQLLRDRMPGCRWMACLAGLLAFSRLFAGMHYPSDILGGGAIAAAVHGVLNKPFAVTFIKKLTRALSLLSDSILYIGKSR